MFKRLPVCQREEIRGGGRRSRLPVVQKRLPVLPARRDRGGGGAADFPLFKKAVGSALREEIRHTAGAGRSKLPIVKKGGKNEKEKTKENRRGGEIYAARRRAGLGAVAARPGTAPAGSAAAKWSRTGTAPVAAVPAGPEQPPQVQRLPYRPDPARPPQVQLLQMQRSALPYVGRAGKNSGAANWVEKLDWKTPSGAPYTSAGAGRTVQPGGADHGAARRWRRRFFAGCGRGTGRCSRTGYGRGRRLCRRWRRPVGRGDGTRSNRGETRPLRWLDDNLFRPAGYLAEKYAGGAGKQAETLWNGMVT